MALTFHVSTPVFRTECLDNRRETAVIHKLRKGFSLFGTLTIGDGLVSQVPALLISVAAGVLVTRTPSKENLGVQFSDQLLSIPKAIAMGSVVMFVLALIPGLPFIPFMAMAILLGLTSYLLFEGEKQKGPQPIVSET